jgi:hypothetical protein
MMRMTRLTLAACAAALFLAAVPARAADAIDSVLTPYFRIQKQLADDKADVKADATAGAEAAAALGSAGDPIAAAARTLASASTLPAARDAFGTLSDALVAYADSTHAALGAGTATAYCPMVKKSWLQQGEAIHNPYYGKSMLGCGTIKKKG